MEKSIEYRIKEEYIGTEIWYKPQVKCKFLWWTYWDNMGNLFRHKHDAEHKIEEYAAMLENPAEATPYKTKA